MKTRVHLISMPWANPTKAPIQIACLKAYLNSKFGEDVSVRTYSPFLMLTMSYESGRFHDFYDKMSAYGELSYQLLYGRRFGFPGRRRAAAYPPAISRARVRLTRQEEAPLTPGGLAALEKATIRYVEERVAPHLLKDGVNLVGFSLNYDQMYASLFCAEYLKRKYPRRKLVFLYGGMSIAISQVAEMMSSLGQGGLGVIGEGEKKLEAVVARCLEAKDLDASGLEDELSRISGVYKIAGPPDLRSRDLKNFETQFKSIDELPLPDYREYFAELRECCADEAAYAEMLKMTDLLIEGTRGCFAKCDFCGLNFTWDGFRKKTSPVIADQTMKLVKEYSLPKIVFADNVCDTWAEDYARALIGRNLVYESFMELRAHHPEEFWTLLSLSGVAQLQIGVESVSPHLLGCMAKGTKVIQNLCTQKYLCELGIRSNSNLITHHPRSNLQDVAQTRRVVEATPHFQPFFLYPFYLSPGSPLYDSLSLEEKRGLKPAPTVSLPSSLEWLRRYALDFSYESPPRLALAPELSAAWDDFTAWHWKFSRDERVVEAELSAARLDADTVRVRDTRFGRFRERVLEGEARRVHDACHAGPKLRDIVRTTGLAPERVRSVLDGLIADDLILTVEDHYLSLALRPRQELVDAFLSRETTPRAPLPVIANP